MGAMRKFLFETNFDKAEARSVAGANGPEAKPLVSLTEDQIEEIRAEAHQQGRLRGLDEARTAAEALMAQAVVRIDERLKDAFAALEAEKDAIKRDAVQAAIAIMRKLVPGFSRTANLTEIEALIASCLSTAIDEPRIVVRVQDALLDLLKERIAELVERAGFAGRVVLIADENLGSADCRVEWADGGAERDTEWLWSQIDGMVNRYLASLSVPSQGGTTNASQNTGIAPAPAAQPTMIAK